jgi:hypothetical protein
VLTRAMGTAGMSPSTMGEDGGLDCFANEYGV